MKKCPHCGSIWVCWNWVHLSKDTIKMFNGIETWAHECWDCENTIETKYKVYNGIPYWFLTRFHKEKKVLNKGGETMKTVITIDDAINGTTVSYKEGKIVNKVVYEFEKDKLNELCKMLWDIKEAVGEISGKYNKERISIQVVHGDRYICKDKKCKICKEENVCLSN